MQGALDLRIRRLEGFGGQQFLFAVVKIAGLAIDQAEFLVKIGFDRTIPALRDGRFQLAGGFGPVMSGGGDDAVICQGACIVQDAPLFLDLT